MDDTDRAEVKEFFRYGGFLRGYDYPRTNVPLLSYSRAQAIGEVCGRVSSMFVDLLQQLFTSTSFNF